MKVVKGVLNKKIILIALFFLSLAGYGQTFNVYLANPSSTSNTLEVDVYINLSSCAKLASVAFGVNYNPAILNTTATPPAAPCTTLNCGSWAMIPGTRDASLSALNPSDCTNRATPVGHLRAVMTNQIAANCINVPAGDHRIGRYRFTSTASPGTTADTPVPWTLNSNAQLWIQPNNSFGSTNTIVSYYPCGQVTPLAAGTIGNGSVSTPNTSGTPLSVLLNHCANGTSTTTPPTTTPVSCFGGNDGTATITLANTAVTPNTVPTNPNITYILDGNATPVYTATLNASGAFTISNLTAGTHTVTITGASPCNTPFTVANIVITQPAQLTNTTTQTNCDSYTWSVTGATYTTSGTYTGTTTDLATGCTVNETLNLTINNSSSGNNTDVVCDTYTWALPLGNGNTYTASTTATNVTTNAAGCPHTQTLNLTINNSTSGTTTADVCDTYTWAAPLGNGNTYTSSTTATFISNNANNCPNTQTLNLTIRNSSSGITNATACDTYTWAGPLGNGNTYTTSQNLTNITTNANNCPHTQTLNLTINNSTSGTTTTTACDTYTWAGPLGNGNTYTSSTTATNITTNAAGCPHTQTLNLTINNSTSGTTTAVVCDTYTWAAPLGNGITYTVSQPTLTHTSTNANGCPNTQTLNLTINNSSSGVTNASACNTYTWAGPLGNGNTYTTSQNLTHITTNANGCPNTQTLNLTINYDTTGTTNASACDTYTWAGPLGNGNTYTTSQTAIQHISTNAAGCQHTQTLNLTINGATSGTTTATACDTYTWAGPLGNGQTYTSSQTATYVSTNANGCPHTETLNLTINNSTSGVTNASACASYTWAGPLGNGQTYTTSQTNVQHVTTNAAGCPHTQTLNLIINSATTGVSNVSACNSYTWAGPLGDGNTYTTNQSNLQHVSTNAAGCQHIQTLNLVINTPTTGTTNASACNSYTWAGPLGNGQTYTTSQSNVTFVSTNANGCQHTQTLNLTINNSTTGTTNATACDSYIWALPLGNGQTYTSSVSNVTHNSLNANGCQHTQTLNLTINNSSSGVTNASVCDSYIWAGPQGNGLTYTSNVTGLQYVSTNAAGCDHTQTLNLNVNYSTTGTTNATACNTYTWAGPLGNGQTYTTSQSGITYVSTNAAGCSHTETLNLTINNDTAGTTTITACDSYTWAPPLGNNQTYTTNQSNITHTSTNAWGCAHVQTLNLTINNGTSGTTTATACDTYTWALPVGNGQTYTSSVFGITKITTNPNGCPHIQTLNLTINNSTANATTVTACDSYTWAGPFGSGLTYTTSGTYTHITTNVNGCPNTETLNLTINSSTTNINTISACGSYTWAGPLGNGQTYTASVSGATNVTTNAAGCSHTEVLNLTINQDTTDGSVTTTANNTYTWPANGQTYTTSGTYTYVSTNAFGCTNTATLNLTINVVVGTTWYLDADGDGYGDPGQTVTVPVAPPGYVAVGTDCDDTDMTINPGAIEVCYDGIDNDCNGVIDNVGQPGGCIAIVTSLMPASCGATLTAMNDKINAHHVVGAVGYRFRIVNTVTNEVVIRDRPVNFVRMSDLAVNFPAFVQFNTTYTIDIALLIGNVWQPYYGAACNVTTPNPVATIGAQCGTILQSMSQWVYSTYYAGVPGYRFRVTNTVTNAVEIKDTVLNRFNFNQLSAASTNTVYLVEVALKNTDGTYMPYGPGCNITTGAIRDTEETIAGTEFKAIAYPNPFAEDFKLDIRTSSQAEIQIRVYDMLGKQIDNRNVALSEIQNLEIGANYPSGVYNLIITQQGNTQSVRVIKR